MTEYVVVDVEATGLNRGEVKDRIIEFSAVVLDENLNILSRYTTLINPERDFGHTDIHGITPEMVAAAPTFAQVAPAIISLLNGRVFVAHNAKYDLMMNRQELEALGCEVNFGMPVDTCSLSRIFLELSNNQLPTVCEYLGVPLTNHHSADADTEATALVFQKLKKRFNMNLTVAPTVITNAPDGAAAPAYPRP